MSERQQHWEAVHAERRPEDRSWFSPRPQTSLALIDAAELDASARIIDVGGGTSRLLDALLDRGFARLTLLDISAAALAEARLRLGPRAERVRFVHADVTHAPPLGPVDLWHDRAVFHFLTVPGDRHAYIDRLAAAVPPGGHVIIATFAEDGPATCSGLPVARYAPEGLAKEIGERFVLHETRHEEHRTPAGKAQRFVYCRFKRR